MRESKLPRWLNVSWWITFPPAAVFVGRMLYESIYLTLKDGEQVVGFAFVHTYPLVFFLSVSGFFLTHLWLVAALVSVLLRPARVLTRVDWLKVGLAASALALLYLPVEKLFGLP